MARPGRKPLGGKAMTGRERAAKHAAKRKANQQAHEEYLENERGRWKIRSDDGQIQKAKDMTRRQLAKQRKKWRDAKVGQKRRTADEQNLVTPPPSPDGVIVINPEEDAPIIDQEFDNAPAQGNPVAGVSSVTTPVTEKRTPAPGTVLACSVLTTPETGPTPDSAGKKTDGRTLAGRRLAKSNRDMAKDTINKLENSLTKKDKTIRALRVQITRLKSKTAGSPDTPRKRVCKMLEGGGGTCKGSGRRQLIYQEAIIDDLSKARKNTWANFISKKTVTKYRGMRKWLLLKHGVDIRTDTVDKEKKNRGRKPLANVKKDIEKFYLENSRTTSGKKDTKTKNKIKVQKRFINNTLSKLHEKYNKSATRKVSFSTFVVHKPFYVLKPNANKRETCNCQKCENLKFMADKLKREGVLRTADLDTLAELSICIDDNDRVSETCISGECGEKHELRMNKTVKENKTVFWDQWTSKKIDLSSRRDGTGPTYIARVTAKQPVEGKLSDLMENFEEEFEKCGARHIITHRHQCRVFQDFKQTMTKEDLIIHCDFAENWNCKYTTEVQSMHFGASRDSVTIHDGVVYSGGAERSFATLSNSPRHDPQAIWTYFRPVLKWALTQYPSTKRIHFWTDGPTTQYRSKSNFYMFHKLIREWHPEIQGATWNFSGAGHGKGAPDGIGAAIKRAADDLVAHGVDIPDAASLFNELSKPERAESKVKLFYTPAREVADLDIIPMNLRVVTGTMRIHQIGLLNDKNNNVPTTGNKHLPKKSEKSFKVLSSNGLWHREFSCYCSHPGRCACFNVRAHSFDYLIESELISPASSMSDSPASPEKDANNITETATMKLSKDMIGSWVIVIYEYDGRPYPGEVVDYDAVNDEVVVRVMRQKGVNSFNWPAHDDCMPYSSDNVKSMISEPMNAKRHFRLTQHDWETYQELL